MIPDMDLQELDRALCALDDARPGPVFTRTEWGILFDANAGAYSSPDPLGHSLAAGPPHVGRTRPLAARGTSPVATLCPWCAWERAIAGHGSAARAQVRVESCPRHSANPNAGLPAAYPKGRWT